MKNNNLINLMDKNQYEQYKNKYWEVLNKIKLVIYVEIINHNEEYLEFTLSTSDDEFNPFNKENYKTCINKHNRFGNGISMIQCIEDYVKDEEIEYCHNNRLNTLRIEFKNINKTGKYTVNNIKDIQIKGKNLI